MLTLDICPVPKPRQTRSDRWKHRDCVMKYRAFADELRLKTSAVGYKLKNSIDVVFVLPMSKSWSPKKQAEMEGKEHQQKPDLDNLIKAFGDALLSDDSQISKIQAVKVWGKDGAIILN